MYCHLSIPVQLCFHLLYCSQLWKDISHPCRCFGMETRLVKERWFLLNINCIVWKFVNFFIFILINYFYIFRLLVLTWMSRVLQRTLLLIITKLKEIDILLILNFLDCDPWTIVKAPTWAYRCRLIDIWLIVDIFVEMRYSFCDMTMNLFWFS